MSMFQPATQVERYLKILAYGSYKTGKTCFALSFTKAGKVALIDTEGGSIHYSTRFAFDVIHTKDFATVMKAITEIKADGGKTYKTLVIDPISVLWTTLQDAGQMLVEKRGNKTRLPGEVIDTSLTPRDWGIIKRQYNKLMTELVNLPMNVVIIAREKDITNTNDQKTGVKPDAEKSTAYIPDIILHFTSDATSFSAVVEGDRTGTYKRNAVIANPSYDSFLSAVKSGTQTVMQDEDQAATATAALLEASDKPKSMTAISDDIALVDADLAVIGASRAMLTKYRAIVGIERDTAAIHQALQGDQHKAQLWAVAREVHITTVGTYVERQGITWAEMWLGITTNPDDVLSALQDMQREAVSA